VRLTAPLSDIAWCSVARGSRLRPRSLCPYLGPRGICRERQRKGAIVGFFIAGAIILVLALLMYFGLFPPSSSEAGATRGAVYGAFGLAGGVFVVLPLCTQYASCCRPISYERFLAGLQRHETAVRESRADCVLGSGDRRGRLRWAIVMGDARWLTATTWARRPAGGGGAR